MGTWALNESFEIVFQFKEKTNPIYDEAHATAYSFIGTQEKSRFYKLWKMWFAYNY